jgi:hypothetical protein
MGEMKNYKYILVRKRGKKRPLGKHGNIQVEDFKTGDKATGCGLNLLCQE